MNQHTAVKLVVRGDEARVIPGVTVRLYGRDTTDAADLLGTATTDENGKARFDVSAGHHVGRSGSASPRSLPALHAVVVDARGKTVTSVRWEKIEKALPPMLIVAIDRELIARHRFFPRKPRATREERERAWIDQWKKVDHKKKPPGDLCLVRMVADVLSGLSAPKNDLQKRAAQQLVGSSAEHLRVASELGARMRGMVDQTGMLNENKCSSELPSEDVWRALSRPGGALSGFSQAVLEVERPPRDIVGPVQAGQARSHPFDGWDNKCIELFSHGQLTGQARRDMENFFHEPNTLVVLDPPVIRKIKVYAPAFQHTVRSADVATKIVELNLFNPETGLDPVTLAMDVAPDNADYLVDHTDPITGRQVLAVDVQFGQTVTINGAGFAAEKAMVTVAYAEWEPIDANSAAAMPLKPQDFEIVGDWPQMSEVHGSAVYGNDNVVFDWPDAGLRPGLYRMSLEFENKTGLPTLSSPLQDKSSCTLGLTDQIVTEPIYFAVLPALAPRELKFEATRVDIVDLTDPEIWPDDVLLTGAFQISRTTYGPTSDTDPTPLLSTTPPVTDSWDKGDRVSWEGDTYRPSNPNILPNGELRHKLDFGADFVDVATITLTASEIDGDFDRSLNTFLTKALLVVLGVIVTLVILQIAALLVASVLVVAGVAAAIIILAAIFTWWGFTWPAAGAFLGADAAIAAALIGIVATTTGALIAATWTAIIGGGFPAADAAIAALINRSDPIASATLVLSGPELAVQMSRVRFHRKVFLVGQRVSGNVTTSTSSDPQGFRQTFVGNGNGGTYRISFDVAV